MAKRKGHRGVSWSSQKELDKLQKDLHRYQRRRAAGVPDAKNSTWYAGKDKVDE